MQKYRFKILSLILVVIYWVFESIVHMVFFDEQQFELIPHDGNELWMRLVIISLLLLFGYYGDRHVRQLKQKEQEKYDLYQAVLRNSGFILNDFLNQMNVVKMEAESCHGFDLNILHEYEKISDQATALIRKMESLDSDLSADRIQKVIH